MALYNHLYAKKHAGKWIMRIEDTDAKRFVPGSVDGIRRALEWAGLDYDFGPGRDGPHSPYYQVSRHGHAYRCFCSEDRLTETREKLARLGSNSTYDKHCLYLTEEEVARRVRAGEKSVIRLNDETPPERPSGFDLVFGQLRDAHLSLATDPILLKSDLFPTYHLASVVDDYTMGITHVLRGEEWLPSLALHLDIYAALKLPTPHFAHIPILLNPDGTKMSKRKGDVQVVDYIRRGWEPSAILNWLALAGWGVVKDANVEATGNAKRDHLQDAPVSTAIMTLPEMIEQFDLTAMTQRSSSLDPMKLEYINKHHLMRTFSDPKGLDALAEKEYIKSVIVLLRPLNEHPRHSTHGSYLFIEPDLSSDEAQDMVKRLPADKRSTSKVVESVKSLLSSQVGPWGELDILDLLHQEQTKLGLPSKVFMKSLRHALTGFKDGPSVADIMKVIGRERTIARLK
ncbi:glutamyl-tRNA synthetase [Cyathus striatus]|nr:glutamyl-tRNA synthetase [Cyathus striatus]